MNVLVADPIWEGGVEILKKVAHVDVKTGLKPDELKAIIGDYDALVVRSQTQVTADIIEAGKKLQIIGRAGVGVDNIDVEAATRHGVIVVNAPTGNTTSAAEHTVALMFALARNVPQANASLKSGQWKRNDFMGIELKGKILGLIGLGNVGAEVARRARGLDMKVVASDPFVSVDHAKTMQVELMPVKHVLELGDFICLHVPLTPQTKGMIGAEQLSWMKPTARLINTARGGLIDEEALVKAIKEKKLAGAAIDVFVKEPTTQSILFGEDKIIVTPHLGASTTEAQELVAKDVAEQIAIVFAGGPARAAVNAPFIPEETMSVLMPFTKAAHVAGRLASQMIEGQIKSLRIKYDGEISECDSKPLKAAALGGLLEEVSEERVNLVNADLVAAKRGLSIIEEKSTTCENYTSLITLEVTSSKGTLVVATTVLRGEVHVVRVNNYFIDIVPTGGYFLFADHTDKPGIISAVSKVTGDANINISYMFVGRLEQRGPALMVLALDEPVPEDQRKKILAIKDVTSARVVKL